MTDLFRAISAIRQGDAASGCTLLSQWLEHHPEEVDARVLWGLTLESLGRHEEAQSALLQGLGSSPNSAPLRYNLGTLLQKQGQLHDARAHLQAAVDADPSHVRAWTNLCATARELGELKVAEEAGRRATELQPDCVDAWLNLGHALKDQARIEAAIAAYERALASDESKTLAGSSALLAQCYLPSTANVLATAHRAFGDRLAIAFAERPFLRRPANPRVRVGYLSADFRLHSVAYFFGSLLNGHDRSRFDVYLYSDVTRPDAVTERMQHAATVFRAIDALSDEALFQQIRADGIDVLVDLAGHTGRRLGVFSRRAAPVQITWLGYPFSTGLRTMDYRLADNITDPPEADAWHTERVLRLPGPFLCYQPPVDSPAVAQLPARRNGYVTFGSFNHLAKLSEDTVVLYSAILDACPGSHLKLKCRSLSDLAVAEVTRERFQKYGISPERLALSGHEPQPLTHLKAYGDVDIALDPTPYNGTTTTLEALWMGVPVLTLCGHWHASRVGASLMTHLGLSTFVASTPEHLVALARELASSRDELEQLRQVLRPTLQKSALCDQVTFARNFEAALVSVTSRQPEAG